MSDEAAMYRQWQLWITEAALDVQRRRVQQEFAEYSRLLASLQHLEQLHWQEALPSWLRGNAVPASLFKH